MPLDPERFAEGLLEYMQRAFAPIARRLEAVERRLDALPDPEVAKRLDALTDQADTAERVAQDSLLKLADLAERMEPAILGAKEAPREPVDIPALVSAAVAEAIRAIPAPEPGKDGTSVTADDIAPMLAEMVAKAVAEIPPPVPGKDGEPGKDGQDGTSVTLDDVAPLVAKAIEAIPLPKDGADCDMSAVLARLETMQAEWALNFERRAQSVIERAAERIPLPKDGKDGLGFEDMDVSLSDDGVLSIKFTRGDDVREFTAHLPYPRDTGVYSETGEYRKGAGVTWGGSWWIAQVDDPQGKPGESTDWRLAVKRGRDGKDASLPKPLPDRAKL